MKTTETAAIMLAELLTMAWSKVMNDHPDRHDEIQQLWSEIQRASKFIENDPEGFAELVARTRQTKRELEAEKC